MSKTKRLPVEQTVTMPRHAPRSATRYPYAADEDQALARVILLHTPAGFLEGAD